MLKNKKIWKCFFYLFSVVLVVGLIFIFVVFVEVVFWGVFNELFYDLIMIKEGSLWYVLGIGFNEEWGLWVLKFLDVKNWIV